MEAFSGMRALVTGGACDIRLATVEQLAAQGERVAVLDVQAPPDERHLYVQGDLRDAASVTAATGAALDALGGLFVLISNAGGRSQGGVEDNPDEEWHRGLDVNVVGRVRITRAVRPRQLQYRQ